MTAATNLTCAGGSFSPKDREDLKRAADECLKLSPVGNCSAGPHGPIGSWDVSAVTDMNRMFLNARSFNQDLSAWDVSAVTDMWGMFWAAEAFNQDLSKWDVSAVTDMGHMFYRAVAFKRKLCGVAWVNSKAEKAEMFTGSPGSISSTVCKTAKSGYREGYG